MCCVRRVRRYELRISLKYPVEPAPHLSISFVPVGESTKESEEDANPKCNCEGPRKLPPEIDAGGLPICAKHHEEERGRGSHCDEPDAISAREVSRPIDVEVFACGKVWDHQ
jgi:hypothetical protein